jgi:hypothetical protein
LERRNAFGLEISWILTNLLVALGKQLVNSQEEDTAVSKSENAEVEEDVQPKNSNALSKDLLIQNN